MSTRTNLGILTHEIVQRLGHDIVAGNVGGEARFPVEADLCQQFDASRSVVREALKILNAKGLITARPRRGTSIRPKEDWNVMDPDVLQWMLADSYSLPLLIEFTRMRLAFEPHASALAAEQGTDTEHAAICAAIDRMKAASENRDDPLAADIAFHLAVLDASNNRFFIGMKSLVSAALRFSIRFTNRVKQIDVGSIPDHERIAEAIVSRRSKTAFDATQALLDEAFSLMLTAQDEAPDKPLEL